MIQNLQSLQKMGRLGGAGSQLINLLSSISGFLVAWPFNDTAGLYAKAVNPAVAIGAKNTALNGDFATDTIWTKEAGWTIAGGVAVATAAAVGNKIFETTPLTPGRTYRITYTVGGYTAGTVRVDCGSTGLGTNRTANGTYVEDIVCAGTANSLRFTSVAILTCTIDNVIVQELNVSASDSIAYTELLTDPSLSSWSGGHPTEWSMPADGANAAVTQVNSGQSHGGTNTTGGSLNMWTDNNTSQAAVKASFLTMGKYYEISVVCSAATAGSISFQDAGETVSYLAISAVGTTTARFYAKDTGIHFKRQAASTDITIDSISIREVNPLDGLLTNGVVLGQAANANLRSSYLFDGTNDVVNIYSLELGAILTVGEGTMLAFVKMSGAGVWTDATLRTIFFLQATSDTNNRIFMRRSTTNNTLDFFAILGGTSKSVASVVTAFTDWFMVALTWTNSSDQLKAYVNGVQAGSTQTGLGTWAGNLGVTSADIGASDNAGASRWSGNIAIPALFNRVLTSAEILAIARAGGVA